MSAPSGFREAAVLIRRSSAPNAWTWRGLDGGPEPEDSYNDAVLGYVSDDAPGLAITPEVHGKRWVITHVGTGFTLCRARFDDAATAAEVAVKLSALGDWTGGRGEAMAQIGPDTVARTREILLASGAVL